MNFNVQKSRAHFHEKIQKLQNMISNKINLNHSTDFNTNDHINCNNSHSNTIENCHIMHIPNTNKQNISPVLKLKDRLAVLKLAKEQSTTTAPLYNIPNNINNSNKTVIDCNYIYKDKTYTPANNTLKINNSKISKIPSVIKEISNNKYNKELQRKLILKIRTKENKANWINSLRSHNTKTNNLKIKQYKKLSMKSTQKYNKNHPQLLNTNHIYKNIETPNKQIKNSTEMYTFIELSPITPNQLNTPYKDSNDNARNSNDNARNSNDYARNSNDYARNSNDYARNSNDYARNSNDYARNSNDYARNARNSNDYARNARNSNDYARNSNDYARNRIAMTMQGMQ